MIRLVPMERAGVIVYQRVDGAPLVAPTPLVERRMAAPPQASGGPPPTPMQPPSGTPAPAPVLGDAGRVVEQLRCLGDAQLDRGKPVEAAGCYAKALEQAPLLADLHLRLALCHLHAREPQRASETLRRALFLTPQLWQAWLLLADLAHEPAQARRYLDQARALLESSSAPPDEPALRAFAGDQAAVLAAVRHRLRGLR